MGGNTLWLGEAPSEEVLDEAADLGVMIFASVRWPWDTDFLSSTRVIADALGSYRAYLSEYAEHPALAGCFLAREIPSEVVKWMRKERVKAALEGMVRSLKSEYPDILYVYEDGPGQEHLQLSHVDLISYKLELEEGEELRPLIDHLHLVAGDRPLVLSQFSIKSGESAESLYQQKKALEEASLLFHDVGVAGYSMASYVEGPFDGAALELSDLPVFPQLKELELQTFCSVIVCSHNGRHRLSYCLEALLKLRDQHYEVILVDDGSSDGTAEVAREYAEAFLEKGVPYRIIEHERVGLAEARNVGARKAHGSILAFTDDDAAADQDWLKWLRKSFYEGAAMCGGYGLLPLYMHGRQSEVAKLPGRASPVLLNAQEADQVPSCNMAVYRSVWEDLGGFRPDFTLFGDGVEMGWRVMETGYRVLFAPCALVWHQPCESYRSYVRQQVKYGMAEGQLLKHYDIEREENGAHWAAGMYAGVEMKERTQTPITFLKPLDGLRWRGRFLSRFYHVLRLVGRWRAGSRPSLACWLVATKRRSGRYTPSLLDRGQEVNYERYQVDDALCSEDVMKAFEGEGWFRTGYEEVWDAEKDGAVMRNAVMKDTKGGKVLLVESSRPLEVRSIIEEMGGQLVGSS